MRKQLLAILLPLFLPMATVNGAATSDVQTANKAFLDADRDFCHKYFEVEAPSEAGYYMALWLMPAKYADGSFTKYSIYVNSAYIGDVNPTRGNWQSAAISGNPKIKLQKGKNVISVACAYPEYPMVEKIVLSPTLANATISSENYDNYLSKATANERLGADSENNLVRTVEQEPERSGSSGLVVNNQPLGYTFFTFLDFDEEQEVLITSTSDYMHYVDALYYQTNESMAVPEDPIGPINPILPNSFGPIIQLRPAKVHSPYFLSDSEERQGLNWKGVSEQALNSNKYITSMRFTAEKEGKYLIRVRTHDNYQLGVADVIVNGAYYYEDVPISSSYAAIAIPADGEEYATYTECEDHSIDDPMLFIHGADADRVVAFNDDASTNNVVDDMCDFDAYISQSFIFPATRVSVNSYSSSSPESTCTIYGRIPVANVPTRKQGKNISSDNGQTDIDEISAPSIEIPSRINIGSSFAVKSSNIITRIAAYNLSGLIVGQMTCNTAKCIVSASSLNISRPGIYILRVETVSGIETQKVMAY